MQQQGECVATQEEVKDVKDGIVKDEKKSFFLGSDQQQILLDNLDNVLDSQVPEFEQDGWEESFNELFPDLA